MHPHLKSLLVSRGLAANATDDDAKKFYAGLSDSDKAACNAKLAKMMDGGDDDDEAAASATPGSPDLNQPRTSTPAPPPGQAVAVPAVPTAAGLSVRHDDGSQQDHAQVAQLERRVKTIKSMAGTLSIPDDELPEFIGDTRSLDDIRLGMLARVASRAKPHASVAPVIGVGKSEAERDAIAIPYAMLQRSNAFKEAGDKFYTMLGITKPEGVDELSRCSAPAMMKRYLSALGIPNAWQLSDHALQDAMGPRGMRRLGGSRIAALAESVSDFGNLTLDAINKSLRFLYLDAKRTWPIWAQKVFNNDFKNINRIALSEVPSMVQRNAGGEVKYVQMQDSKETYALSEYICGLRFTRRLIINDDMDALANVPRLLANTAARLEEDVAYGVLTANPNMADGNAIFSAAHNNVITSGNGGAPTSLAQLQSTAALIETQLGLLSATQATTGAAVLDLEPRFLLVPMNLKWGTLGFIQSEKLVASQSSSGSAPLTVGEANPFFKQLTVVPSTRLKINSPTRWILMNDYREGQVSNVEMCFLTDEPEPVIRQETDFDTEDVKMLGRHTVAGKAIDYRGMASNYGS